jgi:hypothetical protein
MRSLWEKRVENIDCDIASIRTIALFRNGSFYSISRHDHN